MISDDAGEFVKAVEGSQLARGRILVHLAMKFKAAENSVFGSKMTNSLERAAVGRYELPLSMANSHRPD